VYSNILFDHSLLTGQKKQKKAQGKLVHRYLPVLLSCCPVLSIGMEALSGDFGHLEIARSVAGVMAGVGT
jgi:hypothetical protein